MGLLTQGLEAWASQAGGLSISDSEVMKALETLACLQTQAAAGTRGKATLGLAMSTDAFWVYGIIYTSCTPG
jgi:hypothetical protein